MIKTELRDRYLSRSALFTLLNGLFGDERVTQ